MKQYIFGYGSLMNPRSLQKTLPGKTIEKRVCLDGYRRKFNVPVNGYLYLNIVQEKGLKIEGVLIKISSDELEKLKKREVGYACVDIIKNIREKVGGCVFAFIAPDRQYPHMKILRSYINTCLAGVLQSKRQRWLKEIIIDNEIENDLEKPKYKNVDD